MSLFKSLKIISLFASLLLCVNYINANNEEQHIKVVMRTIGDDFLNRLDDSTSRVLPIEKIENRYLIQFDRKLGFEPDILIQSIDSVITKTALTITYIVEVERCDTPLIVHSFEKQLFEDKDLIPCKARPIPLGCYKIFFTILDKSKVAEESNNSWLIGFLLVIILAFIILLWKNKKTDAESKDLVTIGQYLFDQIGMKLILKNKVIELSGKEADLLFLLYSNEGDTVEREIILNKVWGDEGDYVGRTLDVFISKLRKKIEHDPNLKIINIRGIGYRFVVN